MPATQAEIGPIYDLLLATRDGSTLACKNKDGKLVNVSQVAYCTSIDRNAQGQHEETELQHKDQLIQFASSNLIDREFDQWPQVSQGDWSGGSLQRVLTGATPLTSFGPQSDPTRYWDGNGLVWPLTDYTIQQPYMPPPIQDTVGAVTLQTNIATGFVGYFGTPGPGFAYIYNTSGTNTLVYVGGFTVGGTRLTLVNPVDVPGTPQPAAGIMIGAFQALWYTFTGTAGNLDFVIQNPTGTLVATHFDAVIPSPFGGTTLAAATIGNESILAWCLATGPTAGQPLQFTIRLYNLGNGPSFSSASVVPLTLPVGFFVSSMAFLGDSLMIGGTDGHDASIISYNIPSETFSTVARIHDITSIRFCEFAGGLFIAAVDQGGAGQETVDLYLLQGSSLQSIGSIAQSSYLKGSSQPVANDDYAFIAVQDLANSLSIYAYDSLRGRFFRAAAPVAVPSSWGTNWDFGVPLATIPMLNRPAGAAGTAGQGNGQAFTAQWGLITTTQGTSATAQLGQEMYWGCLFPSINNVLQSGCVITSSLIDFTSDQPKLFRQAVLTWLNPGLPSDAAITVRLDVWLDQDPNNLNVSPDFTTGIVATGVNGGVLGQTTLKLPINKIAHKLVYRATTTGPSTTPTAAVKLVSVVIQAATGWVQTLKLDLAPNVQTNSKNGIVWDKQSTPGSPATDHVVAYNFLRQLWRLKGGEVTVTLPNGDTGDWLVQDLHFDSPKPFAASFRADQQTTYQSICTIKLREDL